jgi:hypothetical protein
MSASLYCVVLVLVCENTKPLELFKLIKKKPEMNNKVKIRSEI